MDEEDYWPRSILRKSLEALIAQMQTNAVVWDGTNWRPQTNLGAGFGLGGR